MRDFLILAIIGVGACVALRRPWIGVLLWTWVSLMNPHRYAWGFAYDAPVAAVIAGATILGLLLTREKEHPFKGPPSVVLAVFMLWITISWQMGLDPRGDYPAWDKVMKIYFMILVSLMLLRTKQHIVALAWVCAGSLAVLGAKGGLFTILTGGDYRVYGPPQSFIADNNHFAAALVMTIPLLRFLQLQLSSKWGKHGMTAVMVLVAAAALGSHSRGALLAILAMASFLWWRGRSRVVGGVLIALVAIGLLLFMPDQWGDRMASIRDYQSDDSAVGRLAAWSVAWEAAFDYPFGVGFDAGRPELFARYSWFSELGRSPVAHSIYFQILGHHGFVGLGLFLLIGWLTWRTAVRVRKEANGLPDAKWCLDLSSMSQVAMVGYAVGGAFLNLAYFDLPYYIMVLLVLSLSWVRRRAWEGPAATYGPPGQFSVATSVAK